jgi:2-polyprenyl-3-methyl-5-hydroxy-6-metoxy-1,4-benzoquinol methylase
MKTEKILAAKKIISEGEWYHKIIYDGVASSGTFDYNSLISMLNFPAMDNLSVLDVGCSDGFFSKYFLSHLNASYVTGVDFNQYDGSVAFEVLNSHKNSFEEKYQVHNDFKRLSREYELLGLENSNKYLLLKKIFELNMEYREGSIYNLENFQNHDVTFCGSLLEHLRDPITAIEQLYFKTDKYCIIDISNSFKSKKPYLKYTNSGGNFFQYSPVSITSMMKNIGFKDVKVLKEYKIKIEKYGYKIPHAIVIGYK